MAKSCNGCKQPIVAERYVSLSNGENFHQKCYSERDRWIRILSLFQAILWWQFLWLISKVMYDIIKVRSKNRVNCPVVYWFPNMYPSLNLANSMYCQHIIFFETFYISTTVPVISIIRIDPFIVIFSRNLWACKLQKPYTKMRVRRSKFCLTCSNSWCSCSSCYSAPSLILTELRCSLQVLSRTVYVRALVVTWTSLFTKYIKSRKHFGKISMVGVR